MQNDYSISGECFFFFQPHIEKKAMDGFGGTIKRKVWQEIKSNKCTVHSAIDFYDCAKKY